MDKQLQNRVTYIIYCINAFATRYRLSAKQAFAYLQRFKGLEFLDECYEADSQDSKEGAKNTLNLASSLRGATIGHIAKSLIPATDSAEINAVLGLTAGSGGSGL